MYKLLHLLHMVPMAALAIYLISEGKPAYIAFGIVLGGMEIVLILHGLYNLARNRILEKQGKYDPTKFFDPFADESNFKSVARAHRTVRILEQQFADGHGKSGYDLALILDPTFLLTPEDVKQAIGASAEVAIDYYKRAFPILLRQAEAGVPEAMHLVMQYYQCGLPPVDHDQEQFEYWYGKVRKTDWGVSRQL